MSHFLTPPPVKIRGGVGEISIPIVEDLPTTEPPKYIWWPSVAAEHDGFIKQETHQKIR